MKFLPTEGSSILPLVVISYTGDTAWILVSTALWLLPRYASSCHWV